jgi:tetratricopeptide (TPR) repeat protein
MARGYTVRAHIFRNRLQIRPAWADDRHAVSLPGENPDVLDVYMYSLCTVGRPGEAVPLSERLVSLDPLGPGRYATRAFVQYCARQYAASVLSARRSLQLAPSSERTRAYLGFALLGQGKPVEAEAELRKLEPTYYRRLVGEAVIAARAGHRPVALEKLHALQTINGDSAHYQYGQIYSELGLADEAFKELELAWEVLDPGLASIRIDQFLDPIRSDRRFAALERKLDFP